MLKLTRKKGESVFVGETTVTIFGVSGNRVEMGFDGPIEVSVRRAELGKSPKPNLLTSKLQPIETAPKDGRYILLFGPSGYRTTPLRCAVARWDAQYHPLNPWQTHSNDAFTDGGGDPIYWMELPAAEDATHADRDGREGHQ